jgi:hypothetical protein
MAATVHHEMPFAEYRAFNAVNISRLKLMLKSPKHFKLQPERDSDTFAVGRSVHTMVLQPETYPLLYAVWPQENGRRYGKKWNEFLEANDGKEVVREQDYKLHLAIGRAVTDDGAAGKMLDISGRDGGRPEVSIMWEVDDLYQCKARLDWLDSDFIFDLKTTGSVKPDDFARDAHKYGYNLQAAWYQTAAFMATGERLPFKIVAVEKEPPHDVAVFNLSEAMLADGYEKMNAAFELFKSCTENNHWPGVSDGEELDLDLPAWAKARAEMLDSIMVGGEEVAL